MRIRIQIRIQLLTPMQIRIQLPKPVRIRIRRPGLQLKTYHVNGGVLVGACLGWGPGLGLQVEGGDPVEAVHREGGPATQHVQPLPVAADLVPISEQYFFFEVCNSCMYNFKYGIIL